MLHTRVCIQLLVHHKQSLTNQRHKLRGGRIHRYKSPPLQDFGDEKEVGLYSRVGIYSEFYGKLRKLTLGLIKDL